MSSNSDKAPTELLDNRTLLALYLYLAILFTVSFLALLSEGTAAARLLAFDELYSIIMTVQLLFGLFLLPFIIHLYPNARSSLANMLLVFASGMPIMAVGAFSSATLWHKMVLSQMLLFAFWLLAFWLRSVLGSRLQAGCLYIPLSAVLFFGTLLTGNALAGFSYTGEYIAHFSFPDVLLSWASGDYLGANGWLGLVTCLGALVIWSKKIFVSQHL